MTATKPAPKQGPKPTLFKRKNTSFLKTPKQRMTADEQRNMLAEVKRMQKLVAQLKAEKAGAR